MKHLEEYENLSLSEAVKRMKADTKFYTKMFNTRKRLTHTLYLKVDVGELFKKIVNKEEYGRPFVTLKPKTIITPLRKLRLDVKLQLFGRTCANYIYSFGDFGDN
ncbi:hypothetical protein KAU88_09910 [Candidatus Bathyarchaeota archaeon]|nr:hypothetical protein [Candidatus Bathyarchaeota archaeon]